MKINYKINKLALKIGSICKINKLHPDYPKYEHTWNLKSCKDTDFLTVQDLNYIYQGEPAVHTENKFSGSWKIPRQLLIVIK